MHLGARTFAGFKIMLRKKPPVQRGAPRSHRAQVPPSFDFPELLPGLQQPTADGTCRSSQVTFLCA